MPSISDLLTQLRFCFDIIILDHRNCWISSQYNVLNFWSLPFTSNIMPRGASFQYLSDNEKTETASNSSSTMQEDDSLLSEDGGLAENSRVNRNIQRQFVNWRIMLFLLNILLFTTGIVVWIHVIFLSKNLHCDMGPQKTKFEPDRKFQIPTKVRSIAQIFKQSCIQVELHFNLINSTGDHPRILQTRCGKGYLPVSIMDEVLSFIYFWPRDYSWGWDRRYSTKIYGQPSSFGSCPQWSRCGCIRNFNVSSTSLSCTFWMGLSQFIDLLRLMARISFVSHIIPTVSPRYFLMR